MKIFPADFLVLNVFKHKSFRARVNHNEIVICAVPCVYENWLISPRRSHVSPSNELNFYRLLPCWKYQKLMLRTFGLCVYVRYAQRCAGYSIMRMRIFILKIVSLCFHLCISGWLTCKEAINNAAFVCLLSPLSPPIRRKPETVFSIKSLIFFSWFLWNILILYTHAFYLPRNFCIFDL